LWIISNKNILTKNWLNRWKHPLWFSDQRGCFMCHYFVCPHSSAHFGIWWRDKRQANLFCTYFTPKCWNHYENDVSSFQTITNCWHDVLGSFKIWNLSAFENLSAVDISCRWRWSLLAKPRYSVCCVFEVSIFKHFMLICVKSITLSEGEMGKRLLTASLIRKWNWKLERCVYFCRWKWS